MKTLNFEPTVYRIETKSTDGNTWIWDILTIDGSDPKDTVYFMLKGDGPSWNESDKIQEAIEDEDYQVFSLDETKYKISDFYIDKNIFETAGEGYEEIRKALEIL